MTKKSLKFTVVVHADVKTVSAGEQLQRRLVKDIGHILADAGTTTFGVEVIVEDETEDA